MVNRFTRKVHFGIVYGRTPRPTVDLAALPKLPGASVAAKHLAKLVKATEEEVRQHLEVSYAKYKMAAKKGWRSKIFQKRSCDGAFTQGATADWYFRKAEEQEVWSIQGT